MSRAKLGRVRKRMAILAFAWLSTQAAVFGEPFGDPSGKFKVEIPSGYTDMHIPPDQGFSWASPATDLTILLLPVNMPEAGLETYAANLKTRHDQAGRKVTVSDSVLDGAKAKVLVITKKDLYRWSEVSVQGGRSVLLTVMGKADSPVLRSTCEELHKTFHWTK